MKWAVYNVLFSLAFPFLLPGFLLRMARRGGYRARMLDRFALYPPGLFDGTDRRYVWIHAVSVGEVQVAGQLMREWRRIEPSVRFCFSTTSSTGWKMAEREVAEGDRLIYNPLDFPNFVKSAFAAVKPRAVVLAESEIWPNFIRTARRRGVPVFLVNARVSDRSAPRYAKARFFFADIFRCFAKIYSQSELDKARLVAAGADPVATSVDGSFKFDVARRNPAKERELSSWLEPAAKRDDGSRRTILLGGSTWPGEDSVLLSIARKLDDALLVIAPRHFEKADDVEKNIAAAGYKCVRRSRGDMPTGCGGEVLLADTIGELMGLYALADIVFVGKSLCEHGSQNMIEPCLCGKPTIVGPYTENFRPVMSDLLEGKGILQVEDAGGLEKAIVEIATHGDGGLGRRAREAVLRRQGVVPKCAKEIADAVADGSYTESRHGGGNLLKTALMSIPLAIAAVLAPLAAGKFIRRAPQPNATQEDAAPEVKRQLPMLDSVKMVSAFISLVEKPDAVKVLLCGENAQDYSGAFKTASLSCDIADGSEEGIYDIVFVASGAAADREKYASRLSPKGVLVWTVSVDKVSAAAFKELFDAFPFEDAHLWMPSSRNWLIAGAAKGRKLKMSSVMDSFSSAPFLTVEAEKCGAGSMQELFANYAGSRSDVYPAFSQGDLSVPARPEFFVPKDPPDIGWIEPDDMDADIVTSLADLVMELQLNRRAIIAADLKFTSEGLVEDAVAQWADAMKKNPHDTMLLDRLYVMAVNARAFRDVGNFAAAAQCYEAMVTIHPGDIPVVEEYARTLFSLGKKDMASRIMARAREMRGELDAKQMP